MLRPQLRKALSSLGLLNVSLISEQGGLMDYVEEVAGILMGEYSVP